MSFNEIVVGGLTLIGIYCIGLWIYWSKMDDKAHKEFGKLFEQEDDYEGF